MKREDLKIGEIYMDICSIGVLESIEPLMMGYHMNCSDNKLIDQYFFKDSVYADNTLCKPDKQLEDHLGSA